MLDALQMISKRLDRSYGLWITFLVLTTFLHFHPDSFFISDTISLFSQIEEFNFVEFIFLHWDAHFMPIYRTIFYIEYKAFGVQDVQLYSYVSFALHASYGFMIHLWLRRILLSERAALCLGFVAIAAPHSIVNIYWHIAQGLLLNGILFFGCLAILESESIKLIRKMSYLGILLVLSPLTCAEGILTPIMILMYCTIFKRLRVKYFKLLIVLTFTSYLVFFISSHVIFPAQKNPSIYFNLLENIKFMVVGVVNGCLYQLPFPKYAIPEKICFMIYFAFIFLFAFFYKRWKKESYNLSLYVFLTISFSMLVISLGKIPHGSMYSIRTYYHYIHVPLFLIAVYKVFGHKLSIFSKSKITGFIILIYIFLNFLTIRIIQEKYWIKFSRDMHKEHARLTELFREIDQSNVSEIRLPNIWLGPLWGKIRLEEYYAIFKPVQANKKYLFFNHSDYFKLEDIRQESLNFIKFQSRELFVRFPEQKLWAQGMEKL